LVSRLNKTFHFRLTP